MENEINTNATHIGRKIERIRRLRGMTQTDLGDLLGITKQAVSKMEQSEKIKELNGLRMLWVLQKKA